MSRKKIFLIRFFLIIGIIICCLMLYYCDDGSITSDVELPTPTDAEENPTPAPTETETDIYPPDQPDEGPGGSDYLHNSVVESNYGYGGTEYWLFEPDDPKPEEAPLIIFFHGWGAMDPKYYQAWIDHIVKKGNIVLYPKYQKSIFTTLAQMFPFAIEAIEDAMQEIENGEHIPIQEGLCAVVSHSLGGYLAMNYAAQAADLGLPVPLAVMPSEPGSENQSSMLEDTSTISADTLFVFAVGEDDSSVGDATAITFYDAITQVSEDNKNLVEIKSDYYGSENLKADHFAPVDKTYEDTDALDYYGFWKLFDALYYAAFYDMYRDYALGNTENQRYMGLWSDDTPVNEIEVIYPSPD